MMEEIYKESFSKNEENDLPETNEWEQRVLKKENPFISRGIANIHCACDDKRKICHNTGCCSKMNTFGWTRFYKDTPTYESCDVIEVRFKNARKDFCVVPKKMENLILGDIVVVEAMQGYDIGKVSFVGESVKRQMQKKNRQKDESIKAVLRKATPEDIKKWEDSILREELVQLRARILADSLGLKMKINSVEFQGDMSKATFYYTAEERVDFRQLIKLYAEEFKIRIEMKQIGARQEAGNLGGIGSCGRELCCATFMHSFCSVSTNSARAQQISLNPQKLAGQCGKLKCCLNYEYEVYVDASKDLPPINAVIATNKGKARCLKTDIFKKTAEFIIDSEPPMNITLHGDIAMELFRKSKAGETIQDISSYALSFNKEIEEEVAFENTVGQDELTRFDKLGNNHKNNKNRNKNRNKNKGSNNRKPGLPQKEA